MEAATSTRSDAAAPASARDAYQPLVVVLLATVAGIVLDRFARPGGFVALWLAALVCLVAWRFVWRRRDMLAAGLLLASILFTGAAWHDLHWQLYSLQEIGRFARADPGPSAVEVVARGSSELLPSAPQTLLSAIPSSDRTRIDVRVTAIRDRAAWRPAEGNCQLIVNGRMADVQPGDRLRVFGQLSRDEPPLNPGEFDFAEYARADRRLVRLRSGEPEGVTLQTQGSSWSPARWLEEIRAAALGLIGRNVGSQRAALASAILLGERAGLTNEETMSYLVTGTIHILVVSGMNVAILAVGLQLGMRLGLLGRRAGLAVIMALIVMYTLLAGCQAPIVRAAVLAVLWCVAAWTGRRGMGFNLLACAALVVLAFNPADVFRAGPQLSFLAVGTLIWFSDAVADHRRRHPVDALDQLIAAARPRAVRLLALLWWWNGWLILTTIVVWLTALPLVLDRFHVLTPVTVLISPAVWIVTLIALWSGFLMLLFGVVAPLGAMLGTICNASLAWLEQIVAWAESLRGGHFWSTGPATWWIVGFYVGLVGAMLFRQRYLARRWQLAMLCAWILVGFVPPVYRSVTRDGLECSMLAVGHGTSVLLEGPGGETMLYDAGSLGSPDVATSTISSYLWHRGIMRLDGIVLSHADIDHYNAVPGLLERFRVGAIYMSPAMYRACGFMVQNSEQNGRAGRPPESVARLDGPNVLRKAIERAGVPVRQIWAGDKLRMGPNVSIDVLHPPRLGVVGSDNANSVTLLVEHAGRRVLLPGDLESPGLEELMTEAPRDCDILLAPHHGSRRSDPPGFAAWSRPELVVVSGGREDVSPAIRSYEQSGAAVLQTHLCGTVEVNLGPGPLQTTTWKGAASEAGR